ncbi:bifunctional DNA primase/polymerase [Streptomyces sp. NPDC057494]|uniref:bifunctional DNA primase/polymerase n=1 Tax=Streptomyces sp. NPDC057494 TaxID=3346148 RepID=UPI0036A05505
MTQPTPARREDSDPLSIDLPGLDLLAHAVAAAERGWYVLPLRPGDKRPAGHAAARCPGTGRCADGHKTPEQRATTDPDLLAAAWTHAPYNIGIATGPSGLLVVDLDTLKKEDEEGTPDGLATFKALCERAGQAVPLTHRVRTARGGMHLYFTQSHGIRLGNTAGRLGKHIDTRGWGGYVVAPGSRTPDGAYETLDDRPAIPLPGWLHTALTASRETALAPAPVLAGGGTRAAEVALERETAAVRSAQEGGRNAQLLASTRAVGRFVAWGDIPRHVAEEAFQAAGETSGLTASECRATIRSALDWSTRTARPRPAAA